ncbi:FUSC family protein [uncultured Clostridium sp.]|uniref:FUSC family protein n=1 Tax=uncultured Clostridium sp. TaxID=59620 RepID=UPI00261D9694|nr:FUSC family protein [uncultured Clostridium sp.]
MKKTIITNTGLFLVILIFVVGFQSVFGDNNSVIAVMSITGLLMFLGSDLTGEPVRNAVSLIIMYLLIGVGAFIASTNMYLAIPINLIVVFIISMKFCHILKSPMYTPFTLLYLFLLTDPISGHQLPLRIVALIVGALSIMLPQFIVNKNKIQKATSGILKGYIGLLIQKIDLIQEEGNIEEVDKNAFSMANKLKDIIYDKKEKGFYISDEGKKSLNLLVSLEKINLLILKANEGEGKITLNKIKAFLEIILNLEKVDKESLEKFIKEVQEDNKNTTNFIDIRIISSFIFIKASIEEYSKKTKNQNRGIRNLKEDIFALKDIRMNSIKLKYSMRIAIEVAIACFIMQYFHLHQGKWIIYTVVSLTTPFFELTKTKMRDRVIATILGAIVVGIVFSVVKNDAIRGLLVLLAGYANVYCKTYRSQMIVVTLSSVGSASLVTGNIIGNLGHVTPVTMAIMRISFILIGAIIALIANRYLFRCDVRKANENLESISWELAHKIYDNLDDIVVKENLDEYINNSYLLASQVERTIIENDLKYEAKMLNENYMARSNAKVMLIACVYELEKFLKAHKLTEEERNILPRLISKLKESEIDNKDVDFNKFSTIDSKIVIGYLLGIKENMKIIEENKIVFN